MDQKMLETDNPIVDCYSKLGAVFSILQPHKETWPWLYYNFTHLIYFYEEAAGRSWVDLCNPVFPVYVHEWEACPFLEYNTYLYGDTLRSNIIRVIITGIENNQFIYLTVNRKFIKDLQENKDFVHDMLITGYNCSDRKFLCRDFFHGKYSELWIPFEELKIAFCNNMVPGQKDPLCRVFALRFYKPSIFPAAKLIHITKKLAIENIIMIIDNNQAAGSDVLRMNGTECFSDLQVYDKLVDNLQQNTLDLLDVRPFYAIKNHIKILKEQTVYWNIGDEGKRKRLMDSAEAMCYQSLKTSIGNHQGKGRAVSRSKMINLLRRVKRLETEFILSIENDSGL